MDHDPPPPPVPPPPPGFYAFGSGPAQTPPGAPDLPWEEPGRPLLPALWETILLFLREPDTAFTRMRRDAALLRPVAYAIVLCWFAAIVNGLYSFAFNASMSRLLSGWSGAQELGNEAMLQSASMILSPVMTVFWLAVSGGITHLLIMMLGGNNAGFAVTLRVLSYSASPLPISVVPAVGPLIAGVWMSYLSIKGLSIAHDMSYGKALLVVVLPGVVCCACGVWLFAGMLGATLFRGAGM